MLVYSSIFMAGWNFHFPSEPERLLWRLAGIYMLTFSSVGGGFFFWCDCVYFRRYERQGQDGERGLSLPTLRVESMKQGKVTTKFARFLRKARNLSPDKDSRLEVPIRLLVPYTVFCAVYSIARAYILIEDVIGLRELPSTAFDTVDWSLYLPHL